MSTSRSQTHAAWPYPTLIAHRGGGALAPENTLAAMRLGKDHGYLAVEFDVKLSADAVALLMHDETLERTTSGHGRVADQAMAELEKLDAGSWHGPAFVGERIPRFSAVAHYLHGLGIMANVEIKPCAGREAETGRAVARLCAELWGDRFVKPLVSSFSVPALQAARAAVPGLWIGLLVEQPDDAHFALLDELACIALHCHHRHVSADLVRRVHASGRRLLCYTVNDIDRAAELIAWGVDGIFTDELEIMARQFPERLADGGRPMRDPVDETDGDWAGMLPPMP